MTGVELPGVPVNDTWRQLERSVVRCRLCPRLVAWREEVARTKRRAYRNETYWGRPVPGFGDRSARLLILGLAPGAHGSNRTGRMFTGDSSGETLFGALHRTGFGNQPTALHRDDGLVLTGAFITAVARCVPPKNRPTRHEIANCRPFLKREINLLQELTTVLALGQVAFEGYLRLLKDSGYNVPRARFAHGIEVALPGQVPRMVACYHPSRQNTQTGRLTLEMIDAVLQRIQDSLS